jgi:hypothetical protein
MALKSEKGPSGSQVVAKSPGRGGGPSMRGSAFRALIPRIGTKT